MYVCMYDADSTSVRARGYCGSYSLGSLPGLVRLVVLCCVVLVCSGATYILTVCFLSIYLSRN